MRASPGRSVTVAACCAALAAVPASVAQATAGHGARAISTGHGARATSTGHRARATAPGAALSTDAPPAPAPAGSPAVQLVATPADPSVGAPVHLSVSAVPTGATGFAWDLAGQGAFTRHTATAQTVVEFTAPGAHTVGVRFQDQGHTSLAKATLTVAPEAHQGRGHARRQQAGRAHAQPHAAAHARSHASVHRAASGLSGRVTAHAAGDPGVTIADFHFSPATTTIHVGDTITWSNSGPSSHTATANNGSFNTGVLKKGQSASHTFTQPGTYAYVCQIHSFMHGTIVVLASTTSSTPSTTTPTTAATTPTTSTAAADTGPTLPNTGFNVLGGLLAGVALLGLGAALRRTRAR